MVGDQHIHPSCQGKGELDWEDQNKRAGRVQGIFRPWDELRGCACYW